MRRTQVKAAAADRGHADACRGEKERVSCREAAVQGERHAPPQPWAGGHGSRAPRGMGRLLRGHRDDRESPSSRRAAVSPSQGDPAAPSAEEHSPTQSKEQNDLHPRPSKRQRKRPPTSQKPPTTPTGPRPEPEDTCLADNVPRERVVRNQSASTNTGKISPLHSACRLGSVSNDTLKRQRDLVKRTALE